MEQKKKFRKRIQGEHFKTLFEFPQRDKRMYYFHEYDKNTNGKRTKI